MKRYQTKESVRRGVEAPQKCPCLAACATLRKQPGLFGDDTHAVIGLMWVRQHGLHRRVPQSRWVVKAWPIGQKPRWA